MPFVSVTRLRLRALRFFPAFFVQTWRTRRQVGAATGFRAGALLADRRLTFWTLTVWDTSEDMRTYMMAGAHRTAMPKLMNWCDEASVVHWDQPILTLPDWEEADARMRRDGRPSRVRHPTPAHLAMAFAPLRAGAAGAIKPRGGS